MSKLWRSWMD